MMGEEPDSKRSLINNFQDNAHKIISIQIMIHNFYKSIKN